MTGRMRQILHLLNPRDFVFFLFTAKPAVKQLPALQRTFYEWTDG
jgi:hypothetical protein